MSEVPKNIGEPPGRIAPARELVNTFEYEEMAQRFLSAAAYAEIAGGERSGLERITFRPRMMLDCVKLDMTAELLGLKMFAPIMVGPTADQKRYHAEGELAMVRGATAARTAVVVSSKSSVPLRDLAAVQNSSLWFQVSADGDADAQRKLIDQAVEVGCKALCITIGGADWAAIDRLRQGVKIPVVLKGIMSAEDATAAVGKGVAGIVVSNHGLRYVKGMREPIEALPDIAKAVGGKVPILVDGGFRLGSDIMKAVALGARAVMLARPALWALAAYGSAGVQTMLGMMQSQAAHTLAMLARVNLAAMDPTAVKIHVR
jgi:isopentenyl diphosphate isomerase/L-lactate dehydrogenase-like FMN-dependent dehydrogenase